MSTEGKIPNVPAHPAKGNLQGQTTQAAKIDRWVALNNNLAARLDLLPQFRDQINQFQGVLAQMQTLRDRMKVLKGDADETIKQRDALFVQGDELFTRLSLALRAVHGPESGRLRDFGLKPRKKTGRPRKQPVPTPPPTPDPPPVEIHTSPSESGGPQGAHGATGAPGSASSQE